MTINREDNRRRAAAGRGRRCCGEGLVRLALAFVLGMGLASGSGAMAQNSPHPSPAESASAGESDPVQPEVTRAEPVEEAPADGLWPSDRLMRSLLLRWADQIGTRYELDDQQRDAARKQVLDQWEPFLEAHRRRIQPLANEFLEMRLGVEPPVREHVQAWAERAIPVLEEVRRHVDQGSGRFRELLQPGQRIKFEADALGMTAGMALAEQTLRRWKDGDYDEQQIWHPTSRRGGESLPVARENTVPGSADGQKKPDEESSSAAGTAAQPPDQIAIELDSWTQYVERFILHFELRDAQKTAVLSVLNELKQRAIDHRDRHRQEIDSLERRIVDYAGGEEELNELKSELAKLYGPVDEMFQELCRRAENVPTESQRAVAASRVDAKDKSKAKNQP